MSSGHVTCLQVRAGRRVFGAVLRCPRRVASVRTARTATTTDRTPRRHVDDRPSGAVSRATSRVPPPRRPGTPGPPPSTAPGPDRHRSPPNLAVRRNRRHTHTQRSYSSLNFVRDNLGELVPEGTFRHLLDFLGQNEDNTGRHTNNPDGLPPIQTNWCLHICHPHHLRRMPFLTQPSQFILAWDRHQIC